MRAPRCDLRGAHIATSRACRLVPRQACTAACCVARKGCAVVVIATPEVRVPLPRRVATLDLRTRVQCETARTIHVRHEESLRARFAFISRLLLGVTLRRTRLAYAARAGPQNAGSCSPFVQFYGATRARCSRALLHGTRRRFRCACVCTAVVSVGRCARRPRTRAPISSFWRRVGRATLCYAERTGHRC